MKTDRAKFEPSSKILAIEASALDLWFDIGDTEEESGVDADGIAIVNVSGPLEHHMSWCWDNYDSIRERVRAAIEHDDSKAVVLRIDSPGGVVAGCTELQRDIRKMREETGKPIFAYANEMACSAAYEIACAADEIWLPDTATVGSVGVICALYDNTKANDKWGVRVQLVTSGKRKADSYPDRDLTPEIIKTAQDRVDYFAGIFFDVVAEARGVSVPKIARLEAALYQGSGAVKVKLADGVAGWDDFLAHVKDAIMKTKPQGSKDVALAAAMAALLATAEDPEAVVATMAAAKSTKAKKDAAEDDDEKSEDDEKAAAKDDDTESTDGSTKDSTDAKAEEKSFYGATSGLYTPSRLVRLCRQVTGEKGSIKSLFGAVDALGQQKKAAEKSAARLEKLEARQTEQDVDAMVAKARADGRITKAMVEHLKTSGMKDPKFLKGFLSQLPKLVKHDGEELVERQDVDGQPVANLSSDQKKIIASATAGMSAKEKAEFVAAMNERNKLNGASKAPLT